MRINSGYLRSIFVSTVLMILIFTMMPNAEEARPIIVSDLREYGDWVDTEALFVQSVSGNLILKMTFYGAIPDDHVCARTAEFFIDTDCNPNTGWKWHDMGADCRVVAYVVGGRPYSGLEIWNETTRIFESIENPPVQVRLDTENNFIEVAFPMSTIGLNPGQSFKIVGRGSNYVRRWGMEYSFIMGNNSEIEVDGYPSDWGGINPMISYPYTSITPAEFAVTNIYTTDNSDMLYFRFDVAGTPSTTLVPDFSISRHVYLYIDSDNNIETGYPSGSYKGADYSFMIRFTTHTRKFLSYDSMKWNPTSNRWDFTICDIPMDFSSVFEWGIPLISLGIDDSSVKAIKIMYSLLSLYNNDAVPNEWYLIYTPNQPPVANAGPDQVIEVTGPTTSFNLIGTASSDPDGDSITFVWTDANGNVVGSEPIVSLSRALGTYTYTLTVTDPDGLSSSYTVSVTIQDTTPPALTAPSDLTVDQSDPYGTAVNLGQPTVSDVCDPSPTVVNNAPARFALGETVVTWTATDASGNVGTAQQKVTVVPGSPANQLANLTKLIQYSFASGGIDPELETSLLAKVAAASKALARANPNDAKVAMNELKALVNQVEGQTDKKITPEIAAEIIAWANRVIMTLGG